MVVERDDKYSNTRICLSIVERREQICFEEGGLFPSFHFPSLLLPSLYLSLSLRSSFHGTTLGADDQERGKGARRRRRRNGDASSAQMGTMRLRSDQKASGTARNRPTPRGKREHEKRRVERRGGEGPSRRDEVRRYASEAGER